MSCDVSIITKGVLAELGKDPLRARIEYRRFAEEGIHGRIVSPLRGVVGKVLLGSAEWVEKTRAVLGLSALDPNVPELKRVAWRPSQEQIELAVADEFGVDVSELFAKRIKNNEPRVAAVHLARKRDSVSRTIWRC